MNFTEYRYTDRKIPINTEIPVFFATNKRPVNVDWNHVLSVLFWSPAVWMLSGNCTLNKGGRWGSKLLPDKAKKLLLTQQVRSRECKINLSSYKITQNQDFPRWGNNGCLRVWSQKLSLWCAEAGLTNEWSIGKKKKKTPTRRTCRIQPKFCNRSNEFKRPPKHVQKVLPFIYSYSTSVDKLTFISIAFLLQVLFRIEHENSCNDPIEIPWTACWS